MRMYRYRLTIVGWIGAALLVLPGPIGWWLTRHAHLDALSRVTGGTHAVQAATESADKPAILFVLAATLSAIGLVMLLVGREIREE